MSKTSCAARCSRGSVQGVLRAPAEGEGGVAHHENFSAAATATLERSGGTVAHGKRAARERRRRRSKVSRRRRAGRRAVGGACACRARSNGRRRPLVGGGWWWQQLRITASWLPLIGGSIVVIESVSRASRTRGPARRRASRAARGRWSVLGGPPTLSRLGVSATLGGETHCQCRQTHKMDSPCHTYYHSYYLKQITVGTCATKASDPLTALTPLVEPALADTRPPPLSPSFNIQYYFIIYTTCRFLLLGRTT